MADDESPRLSRKHTITPHEYGRGADKSPRLDTPERHAPEGGEDDNEEDLVRSPSRLSGLLGASVASRAGTQRAGLLGRFTAPLNRRSSKNLLQRSSSRDLLSSSPSRSTSAQLLGQLRPSSTSAASSAAPALEGPTPQSATARPSTTTATSFRPGQEASMLQSATARPSTTSTTSLTPRLRDPTPQSPTVRPLTTSATSFTPGLGASTHQQEVENYQRIIRDLERDLDEVKDARDGYKAIVGQSRVNAMDAKRLLVTTEAVIAELRMQAATFNNQLISAQEQLAECREQLKQEASKQDDRLQRELAQLRDAHQLELSRYDKVLDKLLTTSKHSPLGLRRGSPPSWHQSSEPSGESQGSIPLPTGDLKGDRPLRKNFSDLSIFDDNLRSQALGQLSSSPPAIKRALYAQRVDKIRQDKLQDLLAQNATSLMGTPGEDSQDRIKAFLKNMAEIPAALIGVKRRTAMLKFSQQMRALYEVCALACLNEDINNDLLISRPSIAGRRLPSLRSMFSIWPNVDAEDIEDQRELNSWADDEMMRYQLEEIQAQHCGAHQRIIFPAIISQLLGARYAKMDASGNAQKDANGRDILMGEIETQKAIIAENSQRHFIEDPDKYGGRYLGLDMSAATTQVYFACLIAPGHWISVWFEMAEDSKLKMSACDSLYNRKNDDAYGARLRFLATVLTQHPRSPFHGYTPVPRVKWFNCPPQRGGRDCGYLALHNILSQIETGYVSEETEAPNLAFSAVAARQRCLDVLLKHVERDLVMDTSPEDRLLSSAHNILQLLTDHLYPMKHGVKLLDLAGSCSEIFSATLPDAQVMQGIISDILTALPYQFTANSEQRYADTDAYLADPSGYTIWQPQPGHGRHFTTSTLKHLHVTSELEVPFDADDDLNHDFSLVVSWYRSSAGQTTAQLVDTSLQQPSQLMQAHHARFSRHPNLPVEIKSARDLDQVNVQQRYWIEQRMIHVSSTVPLFQTRNTQGFTEVLNSLNVFATDVGRKLKVCMLAIGWDGLTTNVANMELLARRWPSLSFRLTLLIKKDRAINSAYGRYDPALDGFWYHFDIEYLARLLKLDRRLHVCPRPQLEEHLTNQLQKSPEELTLTENWNLDIAEDLLDLWTPSDSAPCELCMAHGLLSPQGTQLTLDGKLSLLAIYEYYKHLMLLAYLIAINCAKIQSTFLIGERAAYITPFNGLFRRLTGAQGRTNTGLAVIRRECCVCHALGTDLRRCGADASNLRCDPECPDQMTDAVSQSTAAAFNHGSGVQGPKSKKAASEAVVDHGPPAQTSVWPSTDCPMCEEKALSIGAFILHIKEHIDENGGECPRCRKVPTARDTIAHVCTCHGVAPWYCCQCQETFNNARRLSEHFAQSHIEPESEEGPFTCTIEECAHYQGGARVFLTADAWSKHCAYAHSHHYGFYWDLSLQRVCTRVECRKRCHDTSSLKSHSLVHKTAEKKAKESKKGSKE